MQLFSHENYERELLKALSLKENKFSFIDELKL